MKEHDYTRDSFHELLKKTKRGYVSYVVLTPHQGEVIFRDKGRALREHQENKKRKIPSYVGEFVWDGKHLEVVNAHASYRSEELD